MLARVDPSKLIGGYFFEICAVVHIECTCTHRPRSILWSDSLASFPVSGRRASGTAPLHLVEYAGPFFILGSKLHAAQPHTVRLAPSSLPSPR